METNSVQKTIKGNDSLNNFQDEETMELYSRARAKENEIMFLREQTALASIKESQLLNEKHTLERKFSELRLALDEKQNEAITSASNELARRKGDLEENLRLINELKIAEDERYIFMSSMLGLLAEYGIWPRVTNASALSNNIKHLHDQLQLKIKTFHDRISELNVLPIKHAKSRSLNTEVPSSGSVIGQFPDSSMNVHGFAIPSHYMVGQHSESADGRPRYMQDNVQPQTRSLILNHEVHQSANDFNSQNPSDTDRDIVGSEVDNIFDRSGINMRPEEMVNDQFYHSPMSHDKIGSFASEDEGPGIEGFQIIGDAKPGSKLLGCGYPVRGTSLCMFQWVRHYPDGTRQYIEGATNPEYVVTADDVYKVIAVECIPMDDQGHQGDLVRRFANDQNKITCDPDMQLEIDTHISNGQATFSVLMLVDFLRDISRYLNAKMSLKLSRTLPCSDAADMIDSSENWEPTTLFVGRSGFRVKGHQDTIITEKYSRDLLIKIPNGLSTQFVLTSSNGSSYFFSTNNDVRLRDTLVLTVRIFQSKAIDEKRKGKA